VRGEEAIAIFMSLGEHFFLSSIHVTCAFAARGMGDRRRARQHAVAALHAALPARVWIVTCDALCAIALLLADSGAPERSAELYALAEGKHYTGDNPWLQDIMLRELAAIIAGLPPEIAAAAQERGRQRDFWATAHELLAELEAAGWG
jgi:hypothetical protein